MVSREIYYENVRVEMYPRDRSSIRVTEQLDNVVEILPDEEQFRRTGKFYIGNQDLMQSFLVEASKILHTGDPITVFARDGNLISDIHEDLEDSVYTITIVTDGLDRRSDDYIMGLITNKLSEWSRLFRELKNRSNWDELQISERIELVNEIMAGKSFPVGTREREEYERSVDEEARRLGLSDKLLAYELRL